RQIVRQLVTEGFVLALAGATAGLMLGLWASSLLAGMAEGLLPFDLVWAGGANAPVLLATLGFCTAATLAFALGPALTVSRIAVSADLKEQTSDDRRMRRWSFI